MEDVVIAPVGFISDHMEVLYDLDTEARELCEQIGLNMIRAATVGTHPTFVTMIRELIFERINVDDAARAGTFPPRQEVRARLLPARLRGQYERAPCCRTNETISRESTRVRRVCIIGGGISGLAAAHRLVELRSQTPSDSEHAPVEVILIEASPRTGGIIRT